MPKKPAKKTPAKASKVTPKPRKAPAKGKGTPKASKPAPAARKPRKRTVKAPPAPKVLARGSVSLVGPGRIRWECQEAPDGVVVLFVPSGVSSPPRRVSLTLKFQGYPRATSAGKLLGNQIVYQVQVWEGWEKGFRIDVEGVDHAPTIS